MKTKVSLKIIFILVLLISTLPLGVYISLSSLSKLENDANTVNDIGYIRGSTQRLLQCRFNGNQKKIIKEIEVKFQEVDNDFISKHKGYLNISSFQTHYDQLKGCWKELKHVISESNSQEKIYLTGELCWNIADNTTNAATKIAEKKHDQIVITFFVIGTVIFVLLSFTLFLIYTEVRNRLEINVLQDPLTKLYNRNHLLEQLQGRIKSFERSRRPFAILFIDIDHFKQINDSYGHNTGDDILKNFASLLQLTLRDEDIAFRYGGEEFVVLAKDADTSQAYKLAERVRKKVEAYDFKIDHPVSISLGVSEYSKDDTIDKLLTHADNAMYKAKNKGRNQTCTY